jgi:hypothetical protein
VQTTRSLRFVTGDNLIAHVALAGHLANSVPGVVTNQLENSKMATTYVRRFNLKDSLSDDEVVAYWKMLMDELVPVVKKIDGINEVRFLSGAGALRADLRVVIEMDDAGVYERMIADPSIPAVVGPFYAAIDLSTSTQTFLREITPALVHSLSGGK